MTGEINREISYISDQVQLCMLPGLKEDLDGIQVLPSHFVDYHSLLKQELPKLYDILQKNEDVVFNDVQLRTQIVLLLCELTASPTIYRLQGAAEHLLRNAHQLLGKLSSHCQQAEETEIFRYYEQKLHKNCWKRQLGAIHGFFRFLEHHYVNDIKMSNQMLTFSVAVGLKARECFQSEYKQLGVRIFAHLLKHGCPAEIRQLNLQGVIYEHILRETHTMDSVGSSTTNWDCLCLCLDHFDDLDTFTWNQCDDMLERLIQNVSLSSNAEMSVCLLRFITKLGYYFAINKDEISAALASDFTQPNQMADSLEICASLNVCTNYRWAKSILRMLVLDSEKLLHSADTSAQMLLAMQRCYLVCVLPIPLQALHVHLPEFLDKFVAVLMESLVVHKKAQPVLTLTQQFVEILTYHLKNCSPDHHQTSNLKDYVTALENLQSIIAK